MFPLVLTHVLLPTEGSNVGVCDGSCEGKTDWDGDKDEITVGALDGDS